VIVARPGFAEGDDSGAAGAADAAAANANNPLANMIAFNIEDSTFNVPLGIRLGKVVKSGRTVFNMFIEPQFTILHKGVGQPEVQIFTALNMQFLPK